MKNCSALSPIGLGISLGFIWALGLFFLGLLGAYAHYGLPFIRIIGSVYIGYHASFIGSIVGGIWGFVDLFIGGVIIAWVYNCVGRCCCPSEKKS